MQFALVRAALRGAGRPDLGGAAIRDRVPPAAGIARWLLSRGVRVFRQRWLCFGLTIVLGLLAGFITAVVAGLVFAEAVSLLEIKIDPQRSRSSVYGCFAIGLSAVMTPFGSRPVRWFWPHSTPTSGTWRDSSAHS